MTPRADRRDLRAFLDGLPLPALDREADFEPDLTEADLTIPAEDPFTNLTSDDFGPWLD